MSPGLSWTPWASEQPSKPKESSLTPATNSFPLLEKQFEVLAKQESGHKRLFWPHQKRNLASEYLLHLVSHIVVNVSHALV